MNRNMIEDTNGNLNGDLNSDLNGNMNNIHSKINIIEESRNGKIINKNISKSINPKTKIRTGRNRNIYRDNDGAPMLQRTNDGMVEVIGSDGIFIKENVLPTQAKYVIHAWQKKERD